MPFSINIIKSDTFNNCTNLASIEIPVNVTKLEGYCFQKCISLGNVVIPYMVTNIGNGVFRDCTSLSEITILATTPPTLGSSAISSATTKIYVPYGCKTTYETATNWSSLLTRETNPVTFIELNEDGSKPVEDDSGYVEDEFPDIDFE